MKLIVRCIGANILLKNEVIRTNYLKNVSDGKKILLNFFNSKNIKFINTRKFCIV